MSQQLKSKTHTYSSVADFCRINGISRHLYNKALENYSKLEDALDYLENYTGKYTFQGKKYSSYREICCDLQIENEALFSQYASRYGLEQAVIRMKVKQFKDHTTTSKYEVMNQLETINPSILTAGQMWALQTAIDMLRNK